MPSGSPPSLPVSPLKQENCVATVADLVVLDTPGGYHGYWASDLYEINPNYGTAEDLKSLVKAAHEKVYSTISTYLDKELTFPGYICDGRCRCQSHGAR